MKVDGSTISVLDEQFHLHTLLGSSSHSCVYRATHVSGNDVVVRLVFEEGRFFDELARYYALGDSPYFASCLFNYPPASTQGEDLPFASPLGEWCTDFCGDARQVGVLVLECIEGVSLYDTLLDAGDMERVDAMLELSFAIDDLRAAGICHGSLDPSHVLLERDTGEVKIIGIGIDPDWAGALPDRTPFSNAIARDIATLSNQFMPLVQGGGWQFKHFRKRCLTGPPEKRPPNREIQRQLKNVRARLMPRRNLEILFSFMRPMHLLGWMAIIWCSSMAINYLMGDGQVPIQKRRHELLYKAELTEPDLIAGLRGLYGESKDEKLRDMLAEDIAAITRDDPVLYMDEDDATRPIAVFAVEDRPALIGKRELIRIGDWVEVGKRFGYVSKIEFNRIRISYGDAYSWHTFEKPPFFSGSAFGNEVVIVWNNDKNIHRLLDGVAEIYNLELVDNRERTSATTGEITIGDGKVAGLFLANGGLNTFIEELGSIIDIEVNKDQLIFGNSRSELPVYYKFTQYRVTREPVQRMAKRLSGIMGYHVTLDKSLRDKTVTINVYNVTWQELLERCGIRWSVINGQHGYTLYLAPSDGEQSSLN